MLSRTPLLAHLLEQQPVPVDPKVRKKAKGYIGYPPPGMIHKTAYPVGSGKVPGVPTHDAEYPDTPEGRKLADAEAWQFLKRVKVGKRIIKY